jgi:plasmid stabilization system protein ParE
VPTVKFLRRAELELINACSWYEKQQKGLFAKLRREIKVSIKVIESGPKLFAQKYGTELRFVPLEKFPYVIVYWHDGQLDVVFITSIFYTKRDPNIFEGK